MDISFISNKRTKKSSSSLMILTQKEYVNFEKRGMVEDGKSN